LVKYLFIFSPVLRDLSLPIMKHLFNLSFYLFPLLLSAQSYNETQNSLTTPASPKKILIIPYEPKMHISDADHDIAESSNRSTQQMRAMFRTGLAHQLNTTIVTSYPTYSLLEDLRPEAQSELNRIYHAMDYSYDTVFSAHQNKAEANGKKLTKKEQKKELESKTASGDIRFMNVKILDPHLLSDLSQQYGVDLFVFVSQVEIKTNHKDCAGIGLDLFDRDIKVHYAVFDSNGIELNGDIAKYNSDKSTNEVTAIMQENFPPISQTILATLK
jgi:hypothetical protein